MSHEIRHQIQLPFSKAVELAWKNIRVRWWRSILVTSGIVLALAFMTYILVSENLAQSAGANDVSSPGSSGQTHVSAHTTTTGAPETDSVQTWWLVSLALLISFVGILNAMLMSVTERFGEIGTMKCLGALDSFIIKLFLLESAFQGAAGTAIGMLIGVVLAFIEGFTGHGFGMLSELSYVSLFKILGWSLLTGTLLTVAGALYPAWRAARMQPVDAMRWEV